jgi:hypothetical protein
MERSIKSSQRKVRVVAVSISADGTTVTGPDKDAVTVTDTGTGDKLITLNKPFVEAPVVSITSGTSAVVARKGTVSASAVQALTFAIADGTTAADGIVDVVIVGKDVSDSYSA